MSSASPFHKETGSGYYSFEFPKVLKAQLEEKWGAKALPQRSLKTADLVAFTGKVFEGVPFNAQVPMARKLLAVLLGLEIEEVSGYSDTRLAAMLQEISSTNTAKFQAICDEGAWKQGIVYPPQLLPGQRPERQPAAPTPPQPQHQPPAETGRADPTANLPEAFASQMASLQAVVLQQQEQLQQLLKASGSHAVGQGEAVKGIRHPAEVKSVTEWVTDIEVDADNLVLRLETRFLSGLRHVPGGAALNDAFTALRLWVLGCAHFEGWETTPHRELGDHLLSQVRYQYHYAANRIPRRELVSRVVKEDPDMNSIDKAAVWLMSKSASGGKGNQRIQPKQSGNGKGRGQ